MFYNRTEPMCSHKIMIPSLSKRPSILLVYTGGTIGMIENPLTGALEAIDFTYIEEHLPEINAFDYKIDSISLDPIVDSSDIGPEVWKHIAEIIQSHYDSYDGFVILHGTDTMAYTASALSFMLEGLAKPVLFTGAQLPIGKIRTDGKENLLTSIEIAAARTPEGNPRIQEVCIYFNNQLFRGNRCSKLQADLFDAFSSPNYPPLVKAGIDLNFSPSLPKQKSIQPLLLRTHFDTNITVLSVFPGISEDLLRNTFSIPNLKAVVLRTFGSGNAPMNKGFLDAIRYAVERGIIIVNVTQCIVGTVAMSRYSTGISLMNAGVISGYDLTLEAAITKLMFLLGQGYTTEEVKLMFQTDLRGELTHSH